MAQSQQTIIRAHKQMFDKVMLARHAEPATLSLMETGLRALYNTVKTTEASDELIAEFEEAAHELADEMEAFQARGGYLSEESSGRKTALVEASLILARLERSRKESLKRFGFYFAVFAGGLIPFLLIFFIGNLPIFAAHREGILSSAIVFVPLGAVCVAAYMGAMDSAFTIESSAEQESY